MALISYFHDQCCLQYFFPIHAETTRDAKEKEAFVELYAFAFLPHIERCGHSDLKDSLYDDLVVGSFAPVLIPSAIDAIHSQLNCLGLQCKDIGRHLLADESYPECFDHYDLVGYTPVNETRTNMVRLTSALQHNHDHTDNSLLLTVLPCVAR